MTEPRNPRRVLAAALIPGCGHVLMGEAQRGLMFVFFTVVLGWISTKMMPDHATFIGRHIGGVFIYGMSVIDAYRRARLTWEAWHHAQTHRPSAVDTDPAGPG